MRHPVSPILADAPVAGASKRRPKLRPSRRAPGTPSPDPGGLCLGCGWSVPGLRVGLRMAKAQVDEGITARVPLDPRRLLGHAPRTPA